MRRAAVSIGSNVAEGCGREGRRGLVAFLHIALGSASELEFQCELAVALGMCAENDAAACLQEISRAKRMLSRLIKALRPEA